MLLLVKVTYLKVHVCNRDVVSLNDSRVRSTQNSCCLVTCTISTRCLRVIPLQSDTINSCQHYLQKVVILVCFAHEVVLRDNGLLISEAHFVDLNNIHEVDLTAVVTDFDLVIVFNEVLIACRVIVVSGGRRILGIGVQWLENKAIFLYYDSSIDFLKLNHVKSLRLQDEGFLALHLISHAKGALVPGIVVVEQVVADIEVCVVGLQEGERRILPLLPNRIHIKAPALVAPPATRRGTPTMRLQILLSLLLLSYRGISV